MRDLVLIATLGIVIFYIFRRPYLGVLAWAWVSLMNPHLQAYGFAGRLPMNMIIAGITIIAWLASKEDRRLPMDGWAWALAALSLWACLTTLTAADLSWSATYWERYVKTIVFVAMCLVLLTTRERLHAFMLTLALSMSFYAVKGGLFTIVTGGQNKVVGPHGTYIGDNNHLALAMIITIPILNYLRLHSAHRWMRLVLAGGMGLTVLAVLGTYSRGGFVACLAMMAFLWLKSRHKVVTGLIAVALLIPAYQFMPEKYTERLSTLQSAEEDGSVQGRFHSWNAAWQHAQNSPVGAGFNGIQVPAIYYRYTPPEVLNRAAHSIYFQVLGDHGFPGLALYLLVGFLAWRNGSRTIRLCRGDPSLAWARDLAAMLQVSMIGFYVGGAALSMAYFDYILAILAVQAILPRLAAGQASPSPVVRLTPPAPARDVAATIQR